MGRYFAVDLKQQDLFTVVCQHRILGQTIMSHVIVLFDVHDRIQIQIKSIVNLVSQFQSVLQVIGVVIDLI